MYLTLCIYSCALYKNTTLSTSGREKVPCLVDNGKSWANVSLHAAHENFKAGTLENIWSNLLLKTGQIG